MNNVLGFLEHLAFCNPKRRFRYRNGKIVDFNSVELADLNLNRLGVFAERNLSVEKNIKNFVFKFAETEICFSKEVAGTGGRVYVPADFDTKEKPSPGSKPPKKA